MSGTDSRFIHLDLAGNQGDGPANCTPEADVAFCQRYGKNCDPFTNLDNCGASRTVSCGDCTVTGDSCGGSEVANVCGQANCTPESDGDFCGRYGKDCDSFSNLDNCGVSRTAGCGSCTAPASCGGSGVDNLCGEAVCVPESDDDFCARNGKNCDPYTNLDNCGVSRSAGCGSCVSPESCGGAGIPNTCGCTPQSPALFCEDNSKQCGQYTGTDNCDLSRTEQCGLCPGTDLCQSNTCVCTGEVVAAYVHPTLKTLVVVTRTGYLWKGTHINSQQPPSGMNMNGPYHYTTQGWMPNPAHIVATYIVPAASCSTGVHADKLAVLLDNDQYCTGTLNSASVMPTGWDCPGTNLSWPMPTDTVAATFIAAADPCRLTVLYRSGGALKFRGFDYALSEWGDENAGSDAVWPEDVTATYLHPLTTSLMVAITAEGSRYYTYDFTQAFDPQHPYDNWTGHPSGVPTSGWPTPCN